MSAWSPSIALRRWGLAVAAPSAATVLKLGLDSWIGVETPFVAYFGAVTVSAWYGGLGPGLLATVYAAAIATVGFALGRLEAPASGHWLIHALAFALEGALISALCAVLHRAREARVASEHAAREQAEALARDLAHLAALAADNARLHRDVRRSEARKGAMLETSLDAIISADASGRILEFNAAAERMFGWTKAEALGQELADLIVPPALRERHRAGLARYLATGASGILGRRVEMTAVRADGSEFPVELAIARIASEAPPVFTGFLRDITARKQAEETARHAEALRSVTHLANAAAHEINNPLAVVMGNAELLLAQAGPEAAAKLERVLAAGRRIQDIVARMSRITRLEVAIDPPGTPPMLDLRRSSTGAGDPTA